MSAFFRRGESGCLLWVIAVILVLIVLSLLFGGFQMGTKSGSLGIVRPAVVLAGSNPASTT